jgi:hypothetical protein
MILTQALIRKWYKSSNSCWELKLVECYRAFACTGSKTNRSDRELSMDCMAMKNHTAVNSIARSDSENFEQAVLTTDVGTKQSHQFCTRRWRTNRSEELGSFGQMKSHSEKI